MAKIVQLHSPHKFNFERPLIESSKVEFKMKNLECRMKKGAALKNASRQGREGRRGPSRAMPGAPGTPVWARRSLAPPAIPIPNDSHVFTRFHMNSHRFTSLFKKIVRAAQAPAPARLGYPPISGLIRPNPSKSNQKFIRHKSRQPTRIVMNTQGAGEKGGGGRIERSYDCKQIFYVRV